MKSISDKYLTKFRVCMKTKIAILNLLVRKLHTFHLLVKLVKDEYCACVSIYFLF